MSDPVAGLTDMQWYLYRQRNIAFFAAFTDHPFSDADLLQAARGLVTLAPQLNFGFPTGISDEVLRRTIYREQVASLEGLPERWLDRGEAVLSDPALPKFRLRYAALDRPDAEQRAGFLLVQVAHALVEGADSALLTRSQSAEHPVSRSPRRSPLLVKAAATGLGAILAGLHLVAGNFVDVRPGPFRAVTRAYPRGIFSRLAHEHGVRQRALLYGLVLATLFGSGTPGGKRRISSTYSSIDDGGGADRDAYMRMRMRFAIFENEPDFPAFVRALDARITTAETRESGFNAEMNAEGIRLHRQLSRVFPAAYTPRLFQFMPYDVVLGLIPPHRLGGKLTAGLLEPVYAGAALEGANACVIVPNREQVTFNFYIQEKLLPLVGRLDEQLAPLLIPRSESVH
jgi:hypothetical protein